MLRRLPYQVLVAGLTLIAFSAAGKYGIINLDDVIYLIDRAEHYSFSWAFTWLGDAMWTPLTWLSYWADRSVFGTEWGWYHWHNIALHAVSAMLMLRLLMLLFDGQSFRNIVVLCAITLLWSVHPLRVESVVWIASRKDCISTMLFLASVVLWVRSNKWPGLVASIAVLILGGMAKSSVMVFPAFVIAIDVLVLGKRKPYVFYLIVILIGLAFAWEAGFAQKAGGAGYVATMIPSWYRILNAFCSLTIYIKNTLCPTDLAAQCLLRYPSLPRFSPVGFGVLCIGVWYCYKYVRHCIDEKTIQKDPIVAGIFIFSASLVPFLGFIGFGNHSLADRFTVLPSLGVSLICIGIINATIEGKSNAAAKSAAIVIASCMAVIACFSLTRRQTTYWESDRTVFERTLEVDGPSNLLAQEELTMYYYENYHDFNKVFQHGYALLFGPFWQSKTAAHLGPIILEAAYETGHSEEAEQIYDWQKFWGREKLSEIRRQNPFIENLDTLRYSDIVRSAYSDYALNYAEKCFKEIEAEFPDSFIMKDIRYLLARRSGDQQRIKDAIRNAYAPVGESYLKNRWALKMAEELGD